MSDNSVKKPTQKTIEHNKKVAEYFHIDMNNAVNSELLLARKNLIYSARGMKILTKQGTAAWDLNQYKFYERDAVADSVNPSLWLNGKSGYEAGVFEVVPGAIYQVRGLDIANLTIIKSETGWIVQDVMTCVETAAKALELLSETLHEDIRSQVRGVIVSHSHVDHFGGIRAVVDEENVGTGEGQIPIYVPEFFDEEAVKENVFAGTAMGRRGQYQFAFAVAPSETGTVSGGLGLNSPRGTISFIKPTHYVHENGPVIIDGLEVDFQLTPGTEAPAEMNNYFPKYRALWMAENCSCTLHNLYPIRGAQLRDSSGWARYILEAISLYGDKTDVVFHAHHWPHFNTEEEPDAVISYLENTAAIYRYIHDQTLHYANKGYSAKEIAKKLPIPEGLAKNWYTRPYYGSVEINIRAVFTKYLGFYNASPAELDPLTEVEEAKEFLRYAGGVEAVLEKAQADYEAGEYRKVTYAASKAVWAEPENKDARYLLADAYEQLGYQAESSIWRNAYLQGAYELRNGVAQDAAITLGGGEIIARVDPELILEYLGISLDGEKAADKNVKYRFIFTDNNNTDLDEYYVHLYNGTLLSYHGYQPDEPDVVTVRATAMAIAGLTVQLPDSKPELYQTDNLDKLKELSDVLVNLPAYGNFPIAEPLKYDK